MKKPTNLQDAILDEVSQHKIPVTVFLMSGFQIRGFVVGYDSFVVLLEVDGNHQMLYKHAISTLVPRNPVKVTHLTKQ